MDLKNFKKEITQQIINDITEQVNKELNLSTNGTRKSSVIMNPTEEEDMVDGAGIKHLAQHLHKNIKNTINKNHVGRKLANTTKNHIVPIAKVVAKTALKDGALALVESNPELLPLLPVANYTIDKAIGSGIKKPRKKREQSQKEKNRHVLVRNLMKENNMTLPEASSYIKNNNLNY
jgi:hypothetical protein